MSDEKKKKAIVYNIIFLAICLGLFLFLWNAPPETTHRLPHDNDHERFHKMGKKDAEKFCTECHNTEANPLPEGHPPKYRCLFCHKKDG
jgi:cytochrome c553